MKLADSHCHLNYKGLAEQQGDVLRRARDSGVVAMLNISTREREWDDVIAVAEREPDVWATIGVHPHEADQHPDVDTAKLIERAAHPRVVGIGEAGLDFYYEHSPRDEQAESFRTHITAARETGLPLIVHTRDADTETGDILEDEYAKGAFTGLIHCFSSGPEVAKRALALGMYISISGIVTFKAAESLRTIVRELPLDRLLVETDAPYLAPVPYRGKRNEPAFVAATAAAVAALKGVEPEHLASITSENFFKLFSKATPPAESGSSAA